ncbi:hypothetical protein B0H17DRAFT_1202631 [Mycena rosella]|uniref:Uncharacterized protein n=1 Tax=Mycena rosella TaxID=1033263 RepID=A0AAD7GD40_MYCRO|nr:hypothetical protein B0H17DRAFT_1202631 [Mycena rosella]
MLAPAPPSADGMSHAPPGENQRTPARDSPLCPRDPNAKEAATSAQGADGISQPPRDNLLTRLRTHRCVHAPLTRNTLRPAPKAQLGTYRKKITIPEEFPTASASKRADAGAQDAAAISQAPEDKTHCKSYPFHRG